MHIRDWLSFMCMSFPFQTRRALLRDERGATAMEYGLIVGLISIVILLAMTTIGSTMRDDIFNTVSTALQNVLPAEGS